MSLLLLSCAILSAWVYNPHTRDIPLGVFNPVIVADRVTLFESDDSCVVAYRGTDSFQDLFEDLMAQADQHCDHDDGFVQEFLTSFDEIKYETHQEIEKRLKSDKCKDKKIYFTGHSLGAAMAIVAPVEYGMEDFEKIITFGGPKVCCFDFMLGNEKIIRVVNERDPIPALPEPFEVRDLQHCGSHVVALPSRKEMDDFQWPTLKENYDIFDHRIEKYIKNIRGYINNIRSIELY